MKSRRYGTQAVRVVLPTDDSTAFETLPLPEHHCVRRWSLDVTTDRRPPGQGNPKP